MKGLGRKEHFSVKRNSFSFQEELGASEEIVPSILGGAEKQSQLIQGWG